MPEPPPSTPPPDDDPELQARIRHVLRRRRRFHLVEALLIGMAVTIPGVLIALQFFARPGPSIVLGVVSLLLWEFRCAGRIMRTFVNGSPDTQIVMTFVLTIVLSALVVAMLIAIIFAGCFVMLRGRIYF